MRFFIIITLLLTALDQVIKIIVRMTLTSSDNIKIIPNFIHLTYQENRGISFSMLSNLPDIYRVPLLSGGSILVIIGLSIYLYRQWENVNQGERWGFSLVLAGALGNLIDRAIRQEVTDYMHFLFYDHSFFVNNFADDLISIGFVLLVYFGTFKKQSAHE